jgi:hypothetical protein
MGEKKKESIIQSTGVSMGNMVPASEKVAPALPWIILVCSDLGYTSAQPDRVTAADWNEFMLSRRIALHGNFELEMGGQPLFAEYQISSIKDFSIDQVNTRLSQSRDLSVLHDILEKVLDGSKDRDQALVSLRPLRDASDMHREAFTLMDGAKPAEPPKTSSKASAKVERILSVMDLGDDVELAPDQPVQALAAAATGAQSFLPKARLDELAKRVEHTIREQSKSLMHQSFFSTRKASWQCLYDLVKATGRSTEIQIYVYSAPAAEARGELDEILSDCAQLGCIPGFLVWDFPLELSTAGTQMLEDLGTAADRHKTMVLATLASNDPLAKNLVTAVDMAPVFDDMRYLPFKRLRSSVSARHIALCSPSWILDTGEGEPPVASNPVWPAIRSMVQILLDGESPCDTPIDPANLGKLFSRTSVRVAAAIAQEARQFGLSVFGMDSNAQVQATLLRSIIDTELVDAQYGNFGYNLLVNRIAHLAGIWLGDNPPGKSPSNQYASQAQQFLFSQLAAYSILKDINEIRVSLDKDQGLTITINSAQTINNLPIRIELSFGLGGGTGE